MMACGPLYLQSHDAELPHLEAGQPGLQMVVLSMWADQTLRQPAHLNLLGAEVDLDAVWQAALLPPQALYAVHALLPAPPTASHAHLCRAPCPKRCFQLRLVPHATHLLDVGISGPHWGDALGTCLKAPRGSRRTELFLIIVLPRRVLMCYMQPKHCSHVSSTGLVSCREAVRSRVDEQDALVAQDAGVVHYECAGLLREIAEADCIAGLSSRLQLCFPCLLELIQAPAMDQKACQLVRDGCLDLDRPSVPGTDSALSELHSTWPTVQRERCQMLGLKHA